MIINKIEDISGDQVIEPDSSRVDQIDTEININDNIKVTFLFKVDGMTCVACSNAIEGAMRNEYKEKGLMLEQFSLALMTHKMKLCFTKTDAI
jgi:hypothetical protein